MTFDPDGPKQPIPPRVDLREKQGKLDIHMAGPPEAPPRWLRFFAPAFWPVPALLACAIVLIKSKRVWVPVGPLAERTAPASTLLWMLVFGALFYYVPWQRFFGIAGGMMGQGENYYPSMDSLRTNAVDGGCAGMVVRALGLVAFYAIAYTYWKQFM